MKHFKPLLLIVSIFTIFSLELFSHSPEKLELNFDNSTKILLIEAQHKTTNPKKHYVKTIQVFLNDDLRITQNFKKQESKMAQNATFFLFDAKVGDKIKVKAECSIHGEKTKEIVIKETEIKE